MPQVKLRVGSFRITGSIENRNNRFWFNFPYNKDLILEIKAMEGSKWHGYETINPQKVWSVVDSQRNRFQLDFLQEKNPYARWDAPLEAFTMTPRYNLISKKLLTPFKHQPEMAAHMFQRRWSIVAGEMGTGKTLPTMAMVEKVNVLYSLDDSNFWYVAPRAALKAVERDFIAWDCKVRPEFMTYEGFTSKIKKWVNGMPAPRVVVFDEASKLKTPTSQRSQAAKALADSMRQEHGADCWIALLSGTPAPKSPVDWYWLAEVACPGFLKEGNINKFKDRLALIEQRENMVTGGAYPALVTWWDDPKKCKTCAKPADDSIHDEAQAGALGLEYHPFQESINEVAKLYERLKGLVVVYFKKDCLDLPEKHYRVIEVKPSKATLRAAALITKSAKTVISGLTRLRELSDGFQYVETPKGTKTCPRCEGSKFALDYQEVPDSCRHCGGIKNEKARAVLYETCVLSGKHEPKVNQVKIPCPECGETGEVKDFIRETREVDCPKDQALKEILEEHEDVGRIVIYAGFTGSIDRVIKLCHQAGWSTIRVDQGSWRAMYYDGGTIIEKDYLSLFQDKLEEYPKIAFVAHPGSAGMGLTLTAAPTIVYWSNDFNAENRIQSEDRIHRPGMDVNKGATIIDLIHLPTDMKVLENLKKKRELQAMSLGEVSEALKEDGKDREV